MIQKTDMAGAGILQGSNTFDDHPGITQQVPPQRLSNVTQRQ